MHTSSARDRTIAGACIVYFLRILRENPVTLRIHGLAAGHVGAARLENPAIAGERTARILRSLGELRELRARILTAHSSLSPWGNAFPRTDRRAQSSGRAHAPAIPVPRRTYETVLATCIRRAKIWARAEPLRARNTALRTGAGVAAIGGGEGLADCMVAAHGDAEMQLNLPYLLPERLNHKLIVPVNHHRNLRPGYKISGAEAPVIVTSKDADAAEHIY